MDFWRTVVVLLRRWYITVPACLATLGLAVMAYSAVPHEYQSNSVLVLTTPLTGGTETSNPTSLTNPLLSFDHSLSLTAAIVIQQMSSLETAAVLGMTPGGTPSYQVTNGSSNPELLESGPFIFVQGIAASPDAAEDVTDRVVAMVAAVLAQRQTQLKAPDSTHIGIQTVVPTTPGQLLTGNPLRAAAAATALAGLASLAAVYGFESLMTYRRRRRVTHDGATQPEQVSTMVRRIEPASRPAGEAARQAR